MNYKVDVYKNIYDNTYNKVENYNFHNLVKDIYVDVYAAYVNGRILDAGCGEGIHLKRMLRNGYNAFGIELSTVCCEKYLCDVPHENTDILSFSQKGEYFDGLICMDVLEHIPYENINDTIESLSKIADSAFFGIANHSDVLNGIELHLIQKGYDWWLNTLKKHYKIVQFITEQFDSKFFYIYCSNHENISKFYSDVNNILKRCISIDNERIRLLSMYEEGRSAINKLNNNIIQKDNQIFELNEELNNICNTRGYRLLVKYRLWRDRVKEIFQMK